MSDLTDALKRATRAPATIISLSIALADFIVAPVAFAQAPTDAQRAAIRSECRSDYAAHCASVPPGGIESLQCLQKNMSSLASGCQAAVRAVGTPGEAKSDNKTDNKSDTNASPTSQETKAVPAPASPPAKPTAATSPAPAPKPAASSTTKPSSAQISAIRSACRSDYPKVCAGVPTGGAPALQCLDKYKSSVSAPCQKALAAAGSGASPPAAGAAPATAAAANGAATPATAPATPALVLRPMRPREMLFVLRTACGADASSLCAGVPAGGGRIMACLASQPDALSADCKGVLSQFAAQ
jgi:hypothetical protein